MGDLYWWSRYGNFSSGVGILPDMGEVVTHYRTQADFAIAAGVTQRTILEWETAVVIPDPERRVFLAKLLKIPPCLLGLEWRLVYYKDNQGSQNNSFEPIATIVEEDAYYHYEDTLIMAWDMFYNGTLTKHARRFTRRLAKLAAIVKNAPLTEKEAWASLLTQYYFLYAVLAMYQGNHDVAFTYSTAALTLAQEIDDTELVASAFVYRSHVCMAQGNDTSAKSDAQSALQYVEKVQKPLSGNIYLIAAETSASLDTSETLRTQIRHWQDKTINMVYKGPISTDRSFLKLNLASVHHERTKTLMHFSSLKPGNKSLLQDAHSELTLAFKALTPDLSLWRMNFLLTEASLYKAEHDLERSAHVANEALQAARGANSQKGEDQVKDIYTELIALDKRNPHIDNLGVQLGIFQ